MSDKNRESNNTHQRSKLRKWLFNFFSNYIWVGLFIVLGTALIDQYTIEKNYFISVLIELLKSIGIAIAVAAIFTYASGTSKFIEKIQTLLQDIVVNRNFLGNIDSSSKREALNALIKPSNEEIKIYSNIEDYLNTYINNTMDVTKKCVRSNYSVNSRAYIDKEKNKVAVISKISYRLFPTKDGYSAIQLGFSIQETISYCQSIIINTHHGDRDIIKREKIKFEKTTVDAGEINLYTLDLKEYDKSCSHLDIEINMVEYGEDHWMLLSFQAMQPTDGFKHHLRCEDGLLVSQHATFIHGAKFYIDKNDKKNEISTSCNEWINEGSGLSVVISKPHTIDLNLNFDS